MKGFSKQTIITKIHLVISVIIVLPTAIIYGFDISNRLNLNPSTIDEWNFFKSVMALYMGFSILWTTGIVKKSLLQPALISNSIFMLSLGMGRLLSIILDGLPSPIYVLGCVGEFGLGIYGLWVLTSKYLKKF